MHTHQQLLDRIAELKAVNKDLAEQKASLERQQAEHEAERLAFMRNVERQQAEHREEYRRLMQQAERPSLHVCKARVIEELMRHKQDVIGDTPLDRSCYDEDKVWERLLAIVEDDDSDAWDYRRMYRVRVVVRHEVLITLEARSTEDAAEEAHEIADSAGLQMSSYRAEYSVESSEVEVHSSELVD